MGGGTFSLGSPCSYINLHFNLATSSIAPQVAKRPPIPVPGGSKGITLIIIITLLLVSGFH